MKRILILFFVLISVVCKSQMTGVPSGYTGISMRYDWLAGKFRALHVPGFATTPSLQTGQFTGSGAIGLDSVLNLMWYYSDSWIRLAKYTDIGIVSLNGLSGATQTFATGTSGTNFAISSSGTTHTFNIPDASASARGLITTGTQTLAGVKTFSSIPLIPDDAYDATTWNGSLEVPTKNAIRDKVESLTGATPAGNYGNVQLNRNSTFSTPASDSLGYTTTTGLVVKNYGRFLATGSYNQNGPGLSVSNLNFQPYSASNSFFAQNLYYDGSGLGYTYSVTGYAAAIHMLDGQVLAVTAASGTGGTAVSLFYPFKGDYNGNFVAGGNINSANGNFTGGILTVHGGGGSTFGTSVTDPGAGFVAVEKGLNVKATTLNIPVGGPLKDFYTDVSNSTTVETDLYTYPTPANTLSNNGEKLTAHYTVSLSDATADKVVKLYFAGTQVYTSGTLTSTTGDFEFNVKIIRVSATVVRVDVSADNGVTAGAGGSTNTYTEVTGLTLSGTNILKITGQASGATGGSGDLTAKMGSIFWWPASN